MAPPRWQRVWTRGLMVSVVGLLGLGAWAYREQREPKPQPISGVFMVTGRDNYTRTGPNCHTKGGYDDFRGGAQVVVHNESNTVIGTGTLDEGLVTDSGCRFTFLPIEVPKAKFYKVTVHDRGTPAYSFKDMESQGWYVELALGD